MGIRTIIPGPPGTGKTHRLVNHYLEKEIKELKTDPKKNVYLTFGKAGIDEAEARIQHSLLYVSTLHALGTRECKIDTNKQLLNGNRNGNYLEITLVTNYGKTCLMNPQLTLLVILSTKTITCVL